MRERDWLSELRLVVEIAVGVVAVIGFVWPHIFPTSSSAVALRSTPATPSQLAAFTRFLLISFVLAGAAVGGITQGKAFRHLSLPHLLGSFLFEESAVGALWGALIALVILLTMPDRLVGYLFTLNWRRMLVLGLGAGVLAVRVASPLTGKKAVAPLLLGVALGVPLGVIVEYL